MDQIRIGATATGRSGGPAFLHIYSPKHKQSAESNPLPRSALRRHLESSSPTSSVLIRFFRRKPDRVDCHRVPSGWAMGSSEPSSRSVQNLVLYAASAALSCLVLLAGLRHLDPNRAASQKAQQQKKEIAKRLGRPLVSTTPYEDVIACDVINPDSIDVEFDSIGGLDKVKQALYELVILPLRRPELFASGKLLSPQKGVLLYGPPGTGKTMLAKAIARESGAVFINVRISNLMSKWFGDAQKLVSAVFSLAHKLQPAIIFIDEVDSFLGQRRTTDHEAMTNMKTEFMSLWDGFTTDQNARVMVLAATNRPSELDEAILRRFTQIFEIGIPVQSERNKILQVVLKGENVEPNVDYDHIARLCEGFTGSDILEVCKQAAFYPIRELLDNERNGRKLDKPRPLRQSDLERALSTSRKCKKAASSGLQSPLWVRPTDSEDDQIA
ncbi:P-loop containing nucleoside triphosphate hydrolase superfamily protein [Zea mays]|uniref:p-loop containing nucleoside triphosphate hydrolase superfamily protein n=2 Tax=Zea mays TaxID=4577 RepID=A0A1D6LMZ2_MAIZE|nr:P-loop containing nucleoside triphosphate hydrolase superfamily protein [Zea mays]